MKLSVSVIAMIKTKINQAQRLWAEEEVVKAVMDSNFRQRKGTDNMDKLIQTCNRSSQNECSSARLMGWKGRCDSEDMRSTKSSNEKLSARLTAITSQRRHVVRYLATRISRIAVISGF